jgi:hypothetical protein
MLRGNTTLCDLKCVGKCVCFCCQCLTVVRSLGGNTVGDEGAKALGLALQGNTALTHLR